MFSLRLPLPPDFLPALGGCCWLFVPVRWLYKLFSFQISLVFYIP